MVPILEEPIKEIENIENISSTIYKMKIVWRNVTLMSILHISALYGLYLCFVSAKWQTIYFAIFLYIMSGFGITGGAHRLWSHRSYKAKFPLRLILAFLQTMAFENDIYEWSRDHRVHHKFSETNADPYNSKRGFFFAHVGWLLCKKHPEVIEKGKSVNCDDILMDPIVRFQRKFYLPLVTLCCFVIPSVIPYYIWNETYWNAYFVCAILRYCWTLNMTWLVNSAAHIWGRKPYDKSINPSENPSVVFGAMGEGFHNYHHTFPYDYAASEFGTKYNITTCFINLFAAIGWAYDLRTASPQSILQRKIRTGDIAENGDYNSCF